MIRATIIILLVLHAAVVFAGFLAPCDYAEQHRDYPYAPPTPVHFSPRPFVYGLTPDFEEDRSHTYPIHFLTNGRLFGVDSGGVVFLAGSDAFGRDVFSRILYGGR